MHASFSITEAQSFLENKRPRRETAFPSQTPISLNRSVADWTMTFFSYEVFIMALSLLVLPRIFLLLKPKDKS